MTGKGEVSIFGNGKAAAAFAVERWMGACRESVESKGCFAAALSGGRTPVDFYKLLSNLMRDFSLTIMLASHDLEVVPGRVDEIICINQKIFVHARPDEIKDSNVFRDAYGCELEFMVHGRYPHRVIGKHRHEEYDA